MNSEDITTAIVNNNTADAEASIKAVLASKLLDRLADMRTEIASNMFRDSSK